jgi:hypothetical protein
MLSMLGLSRAAPARVGGEDLDLFPVLIRDHVPDENDAGIAAVGPLFSGRVIGQALKACVVGVEGVVVVVGVYASGVHWVLSLWAGSRGVREHSPGSRFPYYTLIVLVVCVCVKSFFAVVCILYSLALQ